MGKIKPDLAGAYVSKVGGVAYYIKDGVNYVRSLSKSEYKSNTPYSKAYKLKQAYETECQHTDQKQRYISFYP